VHTHGSGYPLLSNVVTRNYKGKKAKTRITWLPVRLSTEVSTPARLDLFSFFLSLWMYLWPISQTTWLKITPYCNHCNHYNKQGSSTSSSWVWVAQFTITRPHTLEPFKDLGLDFKRANASELHVLLTLFISNMSF
jgi:hypothetical protein